MDELPLGEPRIDDDRHRGVSAIDRPKHFVEVLPYAMVWFPWHLEAPCDVWNVEIASCGSEVHADRVAGDGSPAVDTQRLKTCAYGNTPALRRVRLSGRGTKRLEGLARLRDRR